LSINVENVNRVSIRPIKIVLDLSDPFGLELPLEDFIRIHKKIPEPPEYKIVGVEVVTCSEDSQPVLVTECGQCARFIRRFNGQIFCKKFLPIE